MEKIYNNYKITPDGAFGHKMIKPNGRGSIPTALIGSFTTVEQAELAIDRYEATKPKEALKPVAKVKLTPKKPKEEASKPKKDEAAEPKKKEEVAEEK